MAKESRSAKKSIEDQISLLGRFIDHGVDHLLVNELDEATKTGLDLLSVAKEEVHSATLHYFLANAFAGIRIAESRQETPTKIPWEDSYIENELVNLRHAFKYFQQKRINKCENDLEYRIATNLGNVLNHIGRFSEAIEYWDYALACYPEFAMAEANRGYGLYHYASVLYDPGHQIIFLRKAKRNLELALKGRLERGAREAFERVFGNIDRILAPYRECPVREYSLGRSKREKVYRAWALENRVFLNPLNDLGMYSIAATDVLTLPSIVTDIEELPHLYGLYNQIKQEFVSARFLLFEGIKDREGAVHFSDRKVLLYNTLDYPAFGLSIEKIKMAFLSLYSLLDKIAFLISHYLKLMIPERNISFRNFWYSKQRKDRGLRTEFRESANWPLRGLFWLSKDFYEEDTGFRGSIEPDAKELNNLRNQMAHKYLKIRDELLWVENHEVFETFKDRLCLSIKRDHLEKKAVKLLKLVRNALIYCALGIHCNEIYEKRKRDDSIIVPMPLGKIRDEWKV